MNKKLILINLLLHVLLSLSFASKLERFSGTSLYQARFDYVLVDDSLVETLKTIIAANEITRDKVIILSRHSDVFLTLKIDDIALVGIIEEYLRQVDFVRGSNLSTTIYLQYTSAVSMATHLHKIFGLSQETVMPNSKVGMTISYTSGIRIVPDEETNSIIIDGPAPAVEKAREIIQSLDSRIPQVLIEVLISEITLNEDSSIGLELDFTGQNSGHHNLNSQVTLDHGSMGNTNSHINTLNNLRGLKATLLNPGNFEAFLQNVQQNNKIKVISRPKILTANNKAANFSATQKTPILKTTNADGVVNNSVDYIDIGVELKVLPRINTDDYINLDITQTIQEVIGTDATALNSPIYSDRVVQTCLLVKNNHTLIMGGIISTSERENISKVPLLGDISLIRDIFRKKSKTRQQTELLIFITPHIMRSYQISDEFTRLQAESLGHAESYQSFEDENKKYAKVHIKNQPFVGNVVSVDIKNKSLMINTVSEDGLEVGKNYEVVRKNQTIFDVNTHQISGYDTDLLAQIMIVRRDSNDLFSALILEQDERNLIKPGDYVRVQRGSMLPDEKFSDTKLHVRIECDNKESPECLARVAVSGKYIGEDALLYDFVNDGACTAETKFFGAKEREYRSEIVETTPIGEYTRYRFKVFFEPVIKKGDDYFLEYVTPLPENWAKEIKKERRFKLNSTNYNDGIYDMVYPDDFPVVDVEPEPVAILHQDGKKIYRYYKAKEKFNLKINHEFGESK